MSTIAITIEGASQTYVLGTLNIPQVANGRGRASFKVRSLDASYRPGLENDVVITEGATRIFGGLVTYVRETGAAGSSVPILTEISAADYNTYADRRTISMAIPAGTLKAALQQLEPVLTPYGVTLDAGQATGPTLPALAYTIKTMREVFDDLVKITADAGEPYAWEIDAFKTLRMFQPSTLPAPFDLAGLPIPQVIGDVVVESTRDSGYANNVTVYVPPKPEPNRVDTFTGDGTTTKFFLSRTLYGWRGYVTNAGVFETLGYVGGGATWSYDPADNSITRTSAPANTNVITIDYDGTLSVNEDEQNAGEISAIGQWDKVIILDTIPDGTTGSQLALAYLARMSHVSTTVRYRTLEAGILPGQSQNINVPRRNLNTDAMVAEVTIRDIGNGRMIRDVVAVADTSQTNVDRWWGSTYIRWGENQIPPSASAIVGTGTVPVGGGGGTNAGIPTFVYKTADETLNNNNTFQDDNHLFFPVPANSVVWAEVVIYTTAANTTPNFKVQWTYPASATILWGNFEGTTNYWGATGAATGNLGILNETSTFVFGGTGAPGNPRAVTFRLQVTTVGTAGTVRLQWAQNTATAVNSTFHLGSWLAYTRIYP